LLLDAIKKFPAAGQIGRWKRAMILSEPGQQVIVFYSFHTFSFYSYYKIKLCQKLDACCLTPGPTVAVPSISTIATYTVSFIAGPGLKLELELEPFSILALITPRRRICRCNKIQDCCIT
jgi:hypothetical protein